MKKLYERHELLFAIVWIALYINLLSIADNVSRSLGLEKLITFPVSAVTCVVLFLWLRRHRLMEKYGLCSPAVKPRDMLYYLPLLLIVSCNAWFGLRLNMSILESLLYVLSMLCVGFLEELIFRGFLFRAMSRDGIKSAIIVSSLTFGIGHIVNLFNGSGAELLPTLLQVCYAVAAGYMFVIIFYRSGSLIPCILAHSGINMLSAFGVEPGSAGRIFSAAALCVISLSYAIYLNRKLGGKQQ